MQEVLEMMTINNMDSIPVVEHDRFVGLISKTRILDVYRRELVMQTSAHWVLYKIKGDKRESKITSYFQKYSPGQGNISSIDIFLQDCRRAAGVIFTWIYKKLQNLNIFLQFSRISDIFYFISYFCHLAQIDDVF